MVVFLDAPQDVLVERLNSRGDLSPRIRSDNELDTFVQNASCLFSVVAPAVLQRTLGIYIDTTKTGNAAIAQIVATKINELTNIDSKC